MSLQTLDLWTLVRKRPQIDPHDLAEALRAEIPGLSRDYRSRLLVRDSLEALRGFWGEVRYRRWLSEIPEGNELDALSREEFDEIGYPSLRGRLMQTTDPEEVRQYLLELGRSVHQPRRIDIGGSMFWSAV